MSARSIPSDALQKDAVHAAVGVAAMHGVEATDPTVLHDGYNVVVWLGPASLVARVHTTTAVLRHDLDERVAREISLVEYLAGRGVPTVLPSDELPPGPHVHGGFTMSVWQHVDVQSATPEPAEAGELLLGLHEALDECPHRTGRVPVISDVEAYLRAAGTFGALSTAQNGQVAALLDELGPWMDRDVRLLHGDAHPGNLLRTEHGWTWFDFEESGAGPVGWDLAALAQTSSLDGEAAVLAYGVDDLATLTPYRRLRLLWGAVWCAVRGERDRRYRDRARELLARAG